MRKLLLLTSILTIMLSSFSFAKTYSIKKEKEGKYVKISRADIEVVLSKGKVFNQSKEGNKFAHIMIYDEKVFYCFTAVTFEMKQNTSYCHTWVSEDSQ